MADEVETENQVEAQDELCAAKDDIVYSLEILAVIKESQQQHGLRHGDYQRYRSYCSRRLRRIRKCVNMVQGIKHRYTPKKINSAKVKDTRSLYIPLVEAERCWSYAMQLKSEANEDHRKRFHMINKLRKAEHYVIELTQLCEEVACDARTKLEVQAYKEWMCGILQFEMKQWHAASELLIKAKFIYEKLSKALTGDTAAVYNQKVAEIEPSVRYCAYNIGDTSAVNDLVGIRLAMGHDDAVLDELIQKNREKQAVALHEVTWKERVIPVKNDKIRVFLLAAQESEQEVNATMDIDAKISVYDRVLKECVEALQLLKEDLKADPIFRQIQRGQQIEGRIRADVFLYTYLMYIKTQKTIQRNLLMVESYKSLMGRPPTEGQKTVKPQDIARLYEIIIQNLSEIPSLPGLQHDDNLATEIDNEVIGNKAFRCYYLAVSYSLGKQWPATVALLKRSNDYCNKALKLIDQNSQMIAGLKDLLSSIDGLLIQAQASSIRDTSQDLVKDMSKLSVANDNRPLADRLDEYLTEDPKIASKKVNLVQLPPGMEPIPCKPLFFDLANNHVQFPKLTHKLEQTQQQQQKAGLTGFVKSWWWGNKK